MAKILSISDKEADGTRVMALDDGSVVLLAPNLDDTQLPVIGSEYPPAPQGANVGEGGSISIEQHNTIVAQMNADLVARDERIAVLEDAGRKSEEVLAAKDIEIRMKSDTIGSLQVEIADVRKGIPTKLREAADHMEGRDHPSAPAVANLDDMPTLDTLKPAKPLETLIDEKKSSAA